MNITFENIYKSFGEKNLFSGVSIYLENKRYCLMGESGCGKTTLLKMSLGLITPDKGAVKGVPQKFSAVFQEDRLCEDLTPVANIKAVVGSGKSKDEILCCLKLLGIEKEAYQPISTLSGGMKRRVAIARALLAEFDFLVLDEPFKGLDESTRESVAGVINQYASDKIILMASHDEIDAKLLNCEIIKL